MVKGGYKVNFLLRFVDVILGSSDHRVVVCRVYLWWNHGGGRLRKCGWGILGRRLVLGQRW